VRGEMSRRRGAASSVALLATWTNPHAHSESCWQEVSLPLTCVLCLVFCGAASLLLGSFASQSLTPSMHSHHPLLTLCEPYGGIAADHNQGL
jgi:hypothetical protein